MDGGGRRRRHAVGEMGRGVGGLTVLGIVICLLQLLLGLRID